jgi:hypothetical protein
MASPIFILILDCIRYCNVRLRTYLAKTDADTKNMDQMIISNLILGLQPAIDVEDDSGTYRSVASKRCGEPQNVITETYITNSNLPDLKLTIEIHFTLTSSTFYLFQGLTENKCQNHRHGN